MNIDNNTCEYIIRLKKSESRMNTHEVRVSLETAKMLQKARFDWECEYAFMPTTEMGDKAYRYNKGKSHDYNNKEAYQFEIYSAPSLDVVQRWLREVKNIAVYVCPSYEPERFVAPNVVADDEKWLMKWQVAATRYDIEADEIDLGDVEEKCFDTYEEAQEAGINKALEIILEKEI